MLGRVYNFLSMHFKEVCRFEIHNAYNYQFIILNFIYDTLVYTFKPLTYTGKMHTSLAVYLQLSNFEN